MMHCADNRRINTLSWVALLLVVAGSSACKWGLRSDRPSDPGAGSGSGSGPGSEGSNADGPLSTDACSRGSTDCDIQWVKTSLVACPSGTCDPGSPNGKGVYVAKDNNYCFLDNGGKGRFCPEAFINLSSSVLLQLRDLYEPQVIYDVKVNASLVDATGAEQLVALRSIRSDRTRLEVTYESPGATAAVTATGSALSSLRLKFNVIVQKPSVQEIHPYEMKLQPGASNDPGLPEGFQRYVVFYRAQGSTAAWYPQCPGERGPRLSSFLGEKRVDGLTGEAIDKPEAVTFGCETGAIDSCLAWGYTPWNPRTGDLRNSDYLFRSCLQAKRAAYFVGQGDLTSYTVSGTEIRKRDQYGINAQRIDRLEAIWTPRGAECLNPRNLRRPELAPSNLYGTPECNPVQWTPSGKLATGPASTALTAP